MTKPGQLRALWAAAAIGAMHLGPLCGSMPPPAMSQIRFDIVSVVNVVGGAYIAWADVLVDSEEELQSWEMTLSWDSASLVSTQADAHAELDDDGKLPVAASPGSGTAAISVA